MNSPADNQTKPATPPSKAAREPVSAILSTRRRATTPPLLVGIVATLIIAPTLGRWCTLSPDSYDYLTTARTLSETGRFPAYFLMRPPGFPLLLAPLFYFDADPPLFAIRILLAAAFVAMGALAAKLFHNSLGRWPAVAVGLLTVTNAVLILQATVALSEIIFIPLQLAALILYKRCRRTTSLTWKKTLAAGVITTAAIMIRTIGVALIPIGVLAILLNPNAGRRRRAAQAVLFFAAALSMPALWHLRQSNYADQSGYGRMWTHALEAEKTGATGLPLQADRLMRFGPQRASDLKHAFIPKRIGWRAYVQSWSPVATAVVALLVLGVGVVRIVKHKSLTDAYALLVLAILALWPWDEGVRLVAPLIPILYGSLVWIILQISKTAGAKRALAARAIIILVLALHAWEAMNLQLDDKREKAETRLELSRRIAADLTRFVPSDAPLLCITQNESNAKLNVIGAAYQTRRLNIRYVDVMDEPAAKWVISGENYAAIEFELATMSTWPPDLRPLKSDNGIVIAIRE